MSPKTTVTQRLYSNLELIQSMHERQPETPIHQVDMPWDAAVSPPPVRVKRPVQPPLPPPPNPKYLSVEGRELLPTPPSDVDTDQSVPSAAAIAPEMVPEAMPPAADVVPEVAPSSPLYEVHTEGPLTYFDYYFEEMGTIVPDVADAPPGRSKLTLGLIGAGAVAATVVSGLVIGDIWQKSQAPEEGKPKDASLKQDAAKNPARPTTVAPEPQNLERSQPSVKPETSPPNRPTLPPRKTSSRAVEPLLLAPPLLSPPAIAAPETLAMAPASPRRVIAPPPANSASSPWIARTIPQVSVAEAARRQAALPPVARPETLPVGNDANRRPAPPGTPLPPDAAAPNAAPLPPPGGMTATTAQPTVDPATALPGAIATPQPLPAAPETSPSLDSPPVSPGLQRLFPVRTGAGDGGDRTPNSGSTATPVAPDQANLMAPVESVAGNATASGRTQKLQDYVNLPKTAPQKAAIALMPLSQQAAVEAGSTAQVGAFTVRQVTPQEYQKEWLASNKTSDDPAIALAFPAYGFIDYQRQMIVVLKEQPDAPLQSQRSPLPNS